MKKILVALSILMYIFTVTQSYATNYNLTNLTIKKLRAVGDYQGTTYDNTLELWFTTPVVWPVNSGCSTTYRGKLTGTVAFKFIVSDCAVIIFI